MKQTAKTTIVAVAASLLMGSCGTYTAEGAHVGGSFGSVLGSAIGGITGGWRGSDIGAVVGMAGGAAIGAAVGAAADQKKAEQMEQYKRERAERTQRSRPSDGQRPVIDGSGFDRTNSGDDVIDFDGAGPSDERAATPVRRHDARPSHHDDAMLASDVLHIRNARVEDADHDGVLRAGEECKISFEVMNRSAMTVYDVQPLVTEVTGNKRIHISPNLHVESIAPHSGIRYTATLLADKKLKDGTAVIRVGVAQGSQPLASQQREFTVPTSRR